MRGQRSEFDVIVELTVSVEHRLAQFEEAKSAAARPVDGLGNAALLAVDDFLQTGLAMRLRVVAHFDTDVTAVHFVGHCSACAGTEETVEDEVVGVDGYTA